MSCRWLTIQEFADRVHVSYSTARKWARKGILSCINIEGVIRICESSTDVFQTPAPKEGLSREEMLSQPGDSKEE